MTDYDIEIEIDADSGEIIWNKGGNTYYYTVEELEGKGLINNALHGNAEITVYSQGRQYTLEEWMKITGEQV